MKNCTTVFDGEAGLNFNNNLNEEEDEDSDTAMTDSAGI